MFSTILVPTEGSPLSKASIDAAVNFARIHGGKIIALPVAGPRHFNSSEPQAAPDAHLYEEMEE